MAGTTVTGSSNLTLLDSRIFANVCDGQFVIDASPSIFLGSGASNVLGIKVQITNPYGVIIRPYQSVYDIAPPITGVFTFAMPTQAGKIQYGIYKVEVQLTDADSTTWVIAKNVNVCTYTSDSHPCDERVRMLADCKNGTVTFELAEPPVFKGKYATGKSQEVRIDYPTASGLASFTTTVGNFALRLFQGVYKATVSVCANYDMGDNIWLQLPYDVIVEKNVKCLLDYSCIYPAIKKLNDQLATCTSQKEVEANTLKVLNALRLLKTAELANDAGEDASDYIHDLEVLLGCTCMCDCSGSPIVNGSPSTSLVIEGCLVTKQTVGITDVYTIGAKNYFLTIDVQSNSIFGISAAVEYDCSVYQQLSFNVAAAYEAIKAEVDDTTEYNFWAAVINNTLNSIDAACLGYNSVQWAALTFVQKINAIKVAACAGGNCTAAISNVVVTQVGADVIITFDQTGGFGADVYVDGVLKGSLIIGTGELTLSGYADGANHIYNIIPKCSNGSQGSGAAAGQFGFLACPPISPPSISDTLVNDATCPYDLTTLVYPTPPVGITVEWHTQNNTLSTTLVADPENVASGVFYAFAKDSNGCYSAATQVTIICASDASCTAPQNLLVVDAPGGFLVSFQSANNPPPSNSYTVKRKAFADPDVDGSYTTIGTPVWNSSTNRWEITDGSGVDNTLYTYKAISNCSSTTPSISYTFANLTCPVLTLTPADDTMDYEFVEAGGQVDKYEVTIYDSTGAVALQTQTIVPVFDNPVQGTFIYLTEDTTYKVRIKMFIGSYSKICDFVTSTTTGSNNFILSSAFNLSIDSASGSGVPSLPPTGLNTSVSGVHTGLSGTMVIELSGSVVTTTKLVLLVNNVEQACQAVAAPGTFNFMGLAIPNTDEVRVTINAGTC